MSSRILLVDDDPLLRRSLQLSLEEVGFEVQLAATAEEGLTLARRSPPDLVLHDISLPGMDGLKALEYYRHELELPLIFLTARRRELDEVLGLELGAADYITKPFAPDILVARIRATLRAAKRATAALETTSLMTGDLEINRLERVVTIKGKKIDLPPRVFDLLWELATHAGSVVSTEALLEKVWGSGFEGEAQVVYVHIRWLRERIEEDPKHPKRIQTVRGVGYRLIARED